MAAPHLITVRVYYEDTDFSGFVYHANYLRFMERGRTELLRACGITQSTLFQGESGFAFVVGRIAVDFQRPGRMDDVLTVETTPLMVRGPLIRLRQRVLRAAEVLTQAEVTVVGVRAGRAARLPPEVKAALGVT